MQYYTSVLVLCWLALATLCILVYENNRMRSETKKAFYISYLFIAIASFGEWMVTGLSMSAFPSRWLLSVANFLDCTLTPSVALAFVAQLQIDNKLKHVMRYLLIGNLGLQIISIFTGWMIQVNEKGQVEYGPLHIVYILLCVTVTLLAANEFLIYSISYRKRNSRSLYAVSFLILLGVFLQEFLGNGNQTTFLGMTLGAALLFIHFSEFFQQKSDDRIHEQQAQITTDALTGLLSRHAYSEDLEKWKKKENLPDDFVVFTIDINGLKNANDMLGHDAGDELICAGASCIEKVLGPWGECYRTGGDEFVVFANMNRAQVENALRDIENETWRWQGEKVKELSLAVGCAMATDYHDLPVEKLVMKSDKFMYEAKEEHYRKAKSARRRES